MTSATDPGFLPKQISPFGKGPLGAPNIIKALQNEPTKHSAMDKGYFEVPVSGRLLRLKFCRTCNDY